MNTELQLQGYASIDEGVYIKGKILNIAVPSYKEIEGRACAVQQKRKVIPVLILQRFSYPSHWEVLKYLSERSAIALGRDIGKLHYDTKQKSSRKMDEYINNSLQGFSESVVHAIMRKKPSIARFLEESMTFIADESESVFPQYYLEASYGYLPKSTISRLLRSGSKPGAAWYLLKLTKVARETEAQIGIHWAVELPFYYDKDQGRMRINGNGTITATNGKTRQECINKVLREVHQQLDEGSWKRLPDLSEERLREAAYEGIKSLENLLMELSEPE
ncbi:MAG TPA: hypothetical protein VJJ75_02830 [Candidatus Nanoarchaeia archaeon]|nr:hypothetical protein [Candidatus Nanoarchaeia archaeon]